MNIKTVTVEIHEKRNHPNGEYSHYDARVSLTAELQEGESAQSVLSVLRLQARAHVADECAQWVEALEQQKKISDAKSNLGLIIGRARDGYSYKTDAASFEEFIQLLSEGEQSEYRDKLTSAEGQLLSEKRERLDRFIARARAITWGRYEQDDFDETLSCIPEDERQGFRDRLAAALAPKTEATAAQTEFAITVDTDNEPF